VGKFIDLTGQRFGRLVVLEEAGRSKSGKVMWLCRCDCGNETVTVTGSLKNGETKSCGCLQKEKAIITASYARAVKSSKIRTKNQHLYKVWYNMLARCTDSQDESYPNYGGRGIHVCAEWQNDFYAFQSWALGHGFSPELTIDRIDNSGDYAPDNCRWATYTEQNNNYRRNVIISFNGEQHTIAEWAKIIGVSHALIWQRIFVLKWSVSRALTEPIHKKKNST